MGPAPARARREAIDHDVGLVREWPIAGLSGLGIPWALARAAADYLDSHQVASLVRRGCLPRLALRIVGQHGIWGDLVPADGARLRRLLTGHGWRCGTDV